MSITAGLEELFVRNRQSLLDFAARLVGPDDAEDVVQTACVKVWARMDSFRGESQLRTWVYAIVKHTALDVLRRRRTRHTVPLTPDVLTAELPDVLLDAELTEATRRLSQLTVCERSALAASIETDDLREGAASLGISPKAYKSRRWRARARLAELNRHAA